MVSDEAPVVACPQGDPQGGPRPLPRAVVEPPGVPHARCPDPRRRGEPAAEQRCPEPQSAVPGTAEGQHHEGVMRLGAVHHPSAEPAAHPVEMVWVDRPHVVAGGGGGRPRNGMPSSGRGRWSRTRQRPRPGQGQCGDETGHRGHPSLADHVRTPPAQLSKRFASNTSGPPDPWSRQDEPRGTGATVQPVPSRGDFDVRIQRAAAAGCRSPLNSGCWLRHGAMLKPP